MLETSLTVFAEAAEALEDELDVFTDTKRPFFALRAIVPPFTEDIVVDFAISASSGNI